MRYLYMTEYGKENKTPTLFCYQVDNNVWGGEYPRDFDDFTSLDKLQRFQEFGITHFIDLTEEDELKPYEQMLWKGACYRRFPIEDGGIPYNPAAVRQLVADIQQIIADRPKAKISIHCWGGVGRTGQIVASYLAINRCLDYDNTMFLLRLHFSRNPKSERRIVPENRQQCEFIRRICEGK